MCALQAGTLYSVDVGERGIAQGIAIRKELTLESRDRNNRVGLLLRFDHKIDHKIQLILNEGPRQTESWTLQKRELCRGRMNDEKLIDFKKFNCEKH